MQNVTEIVKQQIADVLKVSPQQLRDDVPLLRMVADSFAVVELLVELQERLSIQLRQQDLESVTTLADLTGLIVAKLGQPIAVTEAASR